MTENHDIEIIRPKIWFPYEHSWTETPFLFFLAKILPYWLKIRNLFIRHPFISWRIPFPCLSSLNRTFTLGECLILVTSLTCIIVYCVLALILDVEAETSGGVACIPLLLTFMLASHNSIFTFLLGIPFERALFWHKFTAFTAIVTAWVHGIPVIINGADEEDELVTGYAFTIPMTVLVFLSTFPFRRYFWNGFYLLHIIISIALIPLCIIHQAALVLVGIGVWLFDLAVRYGYLAILRNPRKATAKRLPANVVRFTFPKDKFEYSAGQYVFIMVPKVNIFEWHPFSLSSAPHHSMVAIHVRLLGNWTRNLYQKIQSETEVDIFIEGPYGAPEIDIESPNYKLFLLISGGIGITPMQSLCNSLMHQCEQQGRPLDKIWFVWACADKYMVSATFEHDREWAGISNKDSKRLPYSFQPDDLQKVNTVPDLAERKPVRRESADSQSSVEEVLHTEFYLTRARSPQDYEDANIRPELQKYLKFGRPNLPEIFQTMATHAKLHGEKQVATLVCGPNSMVHAVRRLCPRFSDSDVRFDFHSEIFEF